MLKGRRKLEKVQVTASVASEKFFLLIFNGTSLSRVLNGITSMFLNGFLQKSDFTNVSGVLGAMIRKKPERGSRSVNCSDARSVALALACEK